jgi:NADH-quinone oxidoreductase subunit E
MLTGDTDEIIVRGETMLTDDERAHIMNELQRHTHKRAAALDALKIVQRYRGWVSDEIRDIAELLDMSPDELDAIASFYSFMFRKPVGKHIILVCDTISCWVMGYEKVLEHLRTRIGIGMGETSPDGQFTLLPVACLGACDHAPSMMIDEELYSDLTPEKIDGILEKYR